VSLRPVRAARSRLTTCAEPWIIASPGS
jgi:hypothetical protein